MMKKPLRLSALSLVIALSMTSMPVFAQEELHMAATETVHLQVGDIFEILPVTDIDNPSYTWILTQDRTFLEATRAPVFRKRLIQPGLYTLFAEIASQDGSRRVTRNFTLDYRARQPGNTGNVPTATEGNRIVNTTPSLDPNGRVAMPAGTQLLLLTPINPDARPLNIDLDLSRDASGDGSLENDLQADQTFFGSDATPLYLWITDEPLSRHSLSVTAVGASGGNVQRIDVLDEVSARNEGMVQGPMHISSEQTGDRAYRFSAVFDGPSPAGSQLLYQWEFGDGQQSLVTEPDHTYAENGNYTVSLLIRNLRDGKDIANSSTMITVSSETPSDTPSSQASSEVEEPSNDNTTEGRGIGSILMLGGLFVACILFGILVMVGMSFLRKKKVTIADTLEKAEQVLVKSPEAAPTLTIAPPTAPKREEPPAAVAEREKEVATPNPATKPIETVNAKQAPTWLKEGLTGESTAKPDAPTPAAAAPTTPKPNPAPVKQTPSWLQQPVAQPKAATTPATPKPAPQPQQAPKPVAAPQTPAPSVPKPQNAPAWLQTPTTPAPQQTPTPAKPVQAPKQPQQQNRPPVPQQPKPVVNPPVSTPAPQSTAPTPVVQPKPVIPPTPAPQPPIGQAQTPQPTVTPIPVTPPVVTPPPPVVPTPSVAQTPVEAPKPTPIDIPQSEPRASDKPIAIIKAESLNQNPQQNG